MRDLFQSLRTLQEDPSSYTCVTCSTMLQRIPTGGNKNFVEFT